jgi:hypothetical protein
MVLCQGGRVPRSIKVPANIERMPLCSAVERNTRLNQFIGGAPSGGVEGSQSSKGQKENLRINLQLSNLTLILLIALGY